MSRKKIRHGLLSKRSADSERRVGNSNYIQKHRYPNMTKEIHDKYNYYYEHVKGNVWDTTKATLIDVAANILQLLDPSRLERPFIENTASGAIKLKWGVEKCLVIMIYESSTEYVLWLKREDLSYGTVIDADQMLCLAKAYFDATSATRELHDTYEKARQAMSATKEAGEAFENSIHDIADALGETA